MRIRTGVKKDGEITAVHYQSWLDGGAYASYGIATTYYTGALLTVTYRIPAYKFDGVRVYTNKPPCGPKRGHGTTQPRYGFECQIDKIAERKVDLLEDVGALGLVMDLHVVPFECLLDREDRLEVLVVDLDERERIERRVLIERRHGRDGLADVPHAIHRERGLVLSGRHDPHLLGHVGTGHDRHDAGVSERAAGVHAANARVRTRRSQKAAVQHPREKEVVGVPRLAGEVRPRVDLRQASADDAELTHGSCAPVAFVPPAFRRGRGRGPWARSDAPAPPSRDAAFSIAS